ncbi:hypothetical protein LCGC14_0356970 [marine sediment metagenome]|uniref:Uncharacterized protein n=1 Tax=marine sediment metagenome TaxID=412755 RepID=A0A0F9WH43_9ZZZZ
MSGQVTKDDCASYRKTFGRINGVLFTCIGLGLATIGGAAWAGYSAKSELHTHQEVQVEHDKHIDESLAEIKALLIRLDEKLP